VARVPEIIEDFHPTKKTFARRETQLPSRTPVVFTPESLNDPNKKKQWLAFCNKNRGYSPDISLESMCQEMSEFLMPLLNGIDGNAAISHSWGAPGENGPFGWCNSAPIESRFCQRRDSDSQAPVSKSGLTVEEVFSLWAPDSIQIPHRHFDCGAHSCVGAKRRASPERGGESARYIQGRDGKHRPTV
jgi:hypothetical protein